MHLGIVLGLLENGGHLPRHAAGADFRRVPGALGTTRHQQGAHAGCLTNANSADVAINELYKLFN